jgi:hypothetical protein
MGMSRLNSVRSRLVLLFFLITAAAVGVVYLYVVPQLESNLTAQKLSRLESRSQASAGARRGPFAGPDRDAGAPGGAAH